MGGRAGGEGKREGERKGERKRKKERGEGGRNKWSEEGRERGVRTKLVIKLSTTWTLHNTTTMQRCTLW